MFSSLFDATGLVHLISAIFSMLFGLTVLFARKGTPFHVRFGYAYAVSMLVMLLTAFMIFKVTGGFGSFHVAAVISSVTLISGLVPAYLKKPEKTWLEFHYEFMNWSIVGLFAAFWSETFSRFFPFEGFWTVVATATAITVAAGAYLIKSKKADILSRFKKKTKGYTTNSDVAR